METIYRPKRPSSLTDGQRQAKLQKDSEYEIAVQNLSTAFYQKKRTTGVTAKEEETYKIAKSKLWNDYKAWAISQGLYEEVTPEQQLTEVEDGLNEQIERTNLIRAELKKPLLEVKEKAMQVM
ncbi:MAG: hypothetical protein IMY77_00290 [Chloroflexi bacterium]|nr:hypothetical protein [Chloroflexota bacterium]